MDSLQLRHGQKQIAQLHPAALQIVKEHISQEEIESPQIPQAMTTSQTKKDQGLMLDEILNCDDSESLKLVSSYASPKYQIGQMTDQINHLNTSDKKPSDFQIKEKQQILQMNLSHILGGSCLSHRIGQKPRSLSIAEDSRSECLSQRLKGHSTSSSKLLKSRKDKTNNLKISCKDDRHLLGVKRPSQLQLIGNQASDEASPLDLYLKIDQGGKQSMKKRKTCNFDELKLDLNSKQSIKEFKNHILVVDSDDAMDYLQVRKQKGECKFNIKKSSILDKIDINSQKKDSSQGNKLQLGLNQFAKQNRQQSVSDNSSIMGGKWYDQKNIDFKFEITSNVDSIDFPMTQNLNLNLNGIGQGDNQIKCKKLGSQTDDLDLILNSPRQPFQFTGVKVLENQQQIQNEFQKDQLLAESDKKAHKIPRFDFSNLKAFNEILEDEKVSQIDNNK